MKPSTRPPPVAASSQERNDSDATSTTRQRDAQFAHACRSDDRQPALRSSSSRSDYSAWHRDKPPLPTYVIDGELHPVAPSGRRTRVTSPRSLRVSAGVGGGGSRVHVRAGDAPSAYATASASPNLSARSTIGSTP